jgi:hypothetical protein
VRRDLNVSFWVEAALGFVTAFLAILTSAWPDWIEGVFGFDPDHHSGSLEWAIVSFCLVVTFACVLMARRQWRLASELAT